ncbi:LytR/AlgR family response regulator transcription factor [Candidatus Soleaferrea massiliensis]|uniref:LytR/AlgR family response regulator transcription factor n=1 Tax=Candidatus Soleaferrea massiliensis TaxID=1470354 RepID=UPI00058D1893|nr:LytTR family DNA-binding domain-containing protein [Candidatus Soleaferrea massiliensis]
MIRIAVCDSNGADADSLKKLVERYITQESLCAEVELFESGEDIIERYQSKRHLFDIVFITVKLAAEARVMAINRIQDFDRACRVIYLSHDAKKAVEAFQYHVYDYLIKPVRPERLYQSLQSAVAEIQQPVHEMVVLKTVGGIYRLPVMDILYIESNLRVLHIHTRSAGILQKYEKLDVMGQNLPERYFLRCHKSWLINMIYVKGIVGNTFLMQNGQQIPIKANGAAGIKSGYRRFIECLGECALL